MKSLVCVVLFALLLVNFTTASNLRVLKAKLDSSRQASTAALLASQARAAHKDATLIETAAAATTTLGAAATVTADADTSIADNFYVTLIILVCVGIGVAVALVYTSHTAQIQIEHAEMGGHHDDKPFNMDEEEQRIMNRVVDISEYITRGAIAFLKAEYTVILIFMLGFSLILLLVIGFAEAWDQAIFTVIAFWLGSGTSVLSGYIGMRIAVYANSRTAMKCRESLSSGFVTAFKAGCVMGFALSALGVFVLYITILMFNLYWPDILTNGDDCATMFESIAGYGLGGSSIALFGRVGGGIYTKAADVGADLAKIEMDMNEDSPQNPAVIADNVGDNVGDIAGMGADLFGSFAESSCAAMVVIAESDDLNVYWPALCLPLVIASLGIFTGMCTSFVATHISPPTSTGDSDSENAKVESALKMQLLVSTIIMTPISLVGCWFFLPDTEFAVNTTTGIMNYDVWVCVIAGLWSGLLIGYVTEYYTSFSYAPVRELARSVETGAATTIIYGLALGYTSVIVPVIALSCTIYLSWTLADMMGVAMAAIGILSTMSVGLTIDAFGPIADNAGGIAEMSGMSSTIRERTDALDAAGNTTAAIGKGFAIGSAALVSLALWGAYVSTVDLDVVDLLSAFTVAGVVFGAMLPYWFSGMTMRSVGGAALDMVKEVRRQFDSQEPGITEEEKHQRERLVAYLRAVDRDVRDEERIEHLQSHGQEPEDYNPEDDAEEKGAEDMDTDAKITMLEQRRDNFRNYVHQLEDDHDIPTPDYDQCIKISTDASLREMIAPGILVMFTPLIIGYLFGTKCLAGMLIGILASGVQMAISMSNTGGAWDNAKKYIEGGHMKHSKTGATVLKRSAEHKNAVVGDTVGDPMKDTSGPALNILIKLSAITSLVFADTFPSEGYLIQAFN